MIDRWKLYDLIYTKADRLLKKYNPCQIRIENRKLICNNDYMCIRYGKELCCDGCRHLGKKGCTTKCLECKVGMCWQGHSMAHIIYDNLQTLFSLQDIPKEFVIRMDRLKKIMYKYKLHGCRHSKEYVFRRLEEEHPLFYWQRTCKPILEEVTI